jgi:hypothetical protein
VARRRSAFCIIAVEAAARTRLAGHDQRSPAVLTTIGSRRRLSDRLSGESHRGGSAGLAAHCL